MRPLTNATSSGVTLSALGILNLTVSIHSAVAEDDSTSLRTVCNDGHAPTPIRQRYECPVCQGDEAKLVKPTTFVKARQIGDGFVVIPEDVLAKAKDSAAALKKQIQITVHPAVEVSSVLMPSGKSYYLSMKAPTQGALDTYTLLGQLLVSRPDLAFMTKLTLRSATSLFRLTVAGEGTLVLRQQADADLVRQHPEIELSSLDQKLIDLASTMADQVTQPFLVATHGTGKLSNVIADYTDTQTPVPAADVAAPAASGGNVLDLMAALEAGVQARAAAKKAPVKKATAKRAVRKVS